MLRTLALTAVLTTAATAQPRSAPRSEPRDQARAQRRTATRTPRSSGARREFQRLHPCPSTGRLTGTCPGYVVDHVIALKRGGLDIPTNMQWRRSAKRE